MTARHDFKHVPSIPCLFFPVLLLLGAALPRTAAAQYRNGHGDGDGEAGPQRLALHLTESVEQVFAWYYAPVFLAYIVNRYDVFAPGDKPIEIESGSAEQLLSRSIGVSGSVSPGSIDPFTIPHLIIGARLAHAAGRELFDSDADARAELRGTLGLYKTLMYTQVGTQLVKNLVHRTRPDGSDDKSFFSGHSSTTFAAASYLQRETDDALRTWTALDGQPFLRGALRTASASVLYGWAGYVGYSRMRDNKHYLTDVLVGALIGTLIGNAVYDGTHGETGLGLPDISVGTAESGPWIALQVQF